MTSQRNRTTAADLAAAVALGAIDPETIVTTGQDDADAAEAIEIATAERSERVPTDGTAHICDVTGCRHGAAHPAVSQPDRQVKLECTACGAVARMTASAIAMSGGIRCNGGPNGYHAGSDYVPAARRTYVRKAI